MGKVPRKWISVGVLFVFVISCNGCATRPEKISAAYVSPLQYQTYSCSQIGQELVRVNRKILELTSSQQKEADKDAVALGVGLVLFWPALFFMMGDDKKDELARLKGEYEALERLAIEKNCDIVDKLQEARRQQEEYEKMRVLEAESVPDGSMPR